MNLVVEDVKALSMTGEAWGPWLRFRKSIGALSIGYFTTYFLALIWLSVLASDGFDKDDALVTPTV